ncbi:peptidoglycan/xylan/chitin deacetylase (PgdA/CDA1 family) [Azospirillum agricola]|uniref:polysaccharide deacetylase family protein n=1 Tax=Azospirillum agricola TaxID=1720247 RepID=UPI001AE3AB31|nr:polysaccharide deacetylase family protein [Azospirillum agricola]MBP2228838.1 peptidoglycan/xylan/chitin deacetylase (PgdA/CDA1 family) [Azospirillum agricola]
MMGISRRAVLGASLALSLAPFPVAARQRSHAATHGAAPFATEHLIPGSPLDLGQVDLTSPEARVVALTIDDGPDPNDLRILEILRQHEAKATFFCIGGKIARHPDIVLAMAASGNEIGSHSQTHPLMTDLTAGQRDWNLAKPNAALAGMGIHPAWFRPPYGDFDAAVTAQAQAHGLRTVLWTADSQDWKGLGPDAIASRVQERLAPGAVVLMHSTKAASVEALPGILESGKRQGVRFVTMTEWASAMERAAMPSLAMLHAPTGR